MTTRQRIHRMLALAIVVGFTGAPLAFADDRADVEAAQNRVIAAINAKDSDALMLNYVPDDSLVVFDDAMPLQTRGAKAWREVWQKVFSRARKFHVDLTELNIVASSDLAVAHAIVHIQFVGDQGEMKETARVTEAYRKIGGKWLIFHEHLSVPIDPATGKAVFDAKP